MNLFSTAYFPPIAFFLAAINHREIHLEGKEHYSRKSYRNRCEIAGAQGLISLSVPVEKNSRTPVDQIKISYKEDWQSDHLKSMVSAYQSSPFFYFYQEEFSQLLSDKYENLFEMNLLILKWLFEKLGLKISIKITEDFIPMKSKNIEQDYRFSFFPKNRNTFKLPFYQQVFFDKNDFIGNLSILDLLFCKGPQALEYLRKIQNNITYTNKHIFPTEKNKSPL
ncbi:MAG: WbqC family protein [Flavobacteriales bacterium]|jgi:hypothetical protein|nr:WbqC family protein [Flavobacteriales bacterium]